MSQNTDNECMGRESLHSEYSERIAAERRAQKARLNLTFLELSERSGQTQGTVKRALSGKAAIAIDTLIPLAAALQLDVRALLDAAAREG